MAGADISAVAIRTIIGKVTLIQYGNFPTCLIKIKSGA
jgi:hypothetical protein